MKLIAGILVAMLAFAPQRSEDSGDRFGTIDVFLDSGDAELAAWQIEVRDPVGELRIIGVEGGESAAFREPARYDPRALQGGRIVLAALSLADELPRGRARVARLHVAVPSGAPFEARRLERSVVAAATVGARRIDVLLELSAFDSK